MKFSVANAETPVQAEHVGEGWDRQQLLQRVNHWGRRVYNCVKPCATGGKLTWSSSAARRRMKLKSLLSCRANTRRFAKCLLCVILMSESSYLIRRCSAEAFQSLDCVRSANGARGLIFLSGSSRNVKTALRIQAIVVFWLRVAPVGACASLRPLRLNVGLLPVSGLALWSPRVLVLRALLCARRHFWIECFTFNKDVLNLQNFWIPALWPKYTNYI